MTAPATRRACAQPSQLVTRVARLEADLAESLLAAQRAPAQPS